MCQICDYYEIEAMIEEESPPSEPDTYKEAESDL